MVGLSRSSGMLHRHHTWNQAKDLSRSPLGLEYNFLVRNELLRGSGHRFFTDDGDFRHFQYRFVRVMGLDLFPKAECDRKDQYKCHGACHVHNSSS